MKELIAPLLCKSQKEINFLTQMLFNHWSNLDLDYIENELIITTEFTMESFSEELLMFS